MKERNSAGVMFVKNLGIAINKNKVYLCRCPHCGNEFQTFASDYYNNRNGCKCKLVKQNNPRLYSIWINMKTRCYNPKIREYKDYGGRGIKICEEWRNSFKAFYEWSISNGYSDTLSIDRIDVNGNYSPDNCKWSDRIEQANNKRTTVMINGMSLKRFCIEHNINYKTVHTRKTRHPELSIEEVVKPYLDRAIKEVEQNAE